jgi:two-component system, NarL family, response regulator NreC
MRSLKETPPTPDREPSLARAPDHAENASVDDDVSTRSSLPHIITVLLIDSRTLVREALRALIEQEPDLAVVAQATTIRSAGTFNVEPDVIVTDIELPDARDGDVIVGIRRFFPRSAILVLTLVNRPARVQSMLTAGADGYVLETAASAELLTAIRALARGETFLQSSLGVELGRWHRPRATQGLSPKEEQVVRLLALGHTNAEIAQLGGVSLRTVEAHRSRIYQKLGHPSRAELVQYAQNIGLVGLDPKPQ